jgi:two-component system chemotaxis response regulator CheY
MATVLIIDDDAGMRRVLRLTLERVGHTVSEAANGVEGVSRYRSAPTDLVITDVYMPDQDGIETIQMLREEFPATRILAISGGAVSGSGAALTDARMLGADATLAKPFAMEALVRCVTELLDG